jgi:PAS domain S-box-containing protein
MKKTIFFLILITVVGVNISFSQSKTDSLTHLLSLTENDTTKLSLYLQIGSEFKKSKPDTALFFFNKVKNSTVRNSRFYVAKSYIEIAVFESEIKNNNKKADSLTDIGLLMFRNIQQTKHSSNSKQIELSIAKCLYYKAKFARALQNPENAISYNDSSMQIYVETKDSTSIIFVNILKGNIYLDLSAYDKALNCFFLSLDLAEKRKDNNYIARNLNNIGYVYFWMNEYQNALIYWKKSLVIAQKLKSEPMIGKIKLNIGNIYNHNKNSDSALIYYQEALNTLLKTKDKNGIILSYNNIGNVLIQKKEYEKAFDQYQKGLDFCKKIADSSNMALIYNNLSNLYFDKKDFAESLKNANKALFYSRRVSDLQKQSSAYQHLLDNFKQLGDYKNALDNYILYTKLKDSIFNQEKIKSIQDLDIKYKTQKKEQENKLLRKDKVLKEVTIQKQRNAVILAIIIIVLVLLSSVILFISRRKLKIYTNLLLEQREEILQQKEEIQAQADSLHDTNTTLEKLNIELEKLSIVASETDNAVVIMDKEGVFQWVNEGFTRLYGYTFNEIKEKSNNIYTISSNPQIKLIVQNCIKNKESAIYESFIISKKEEKIWVQTTITPIFDSTNQLTKIIAIDSDIRKVKAYEAELKNKNEQITSSIRYAKTIQTAILPVKEQIDRDFENFIIYRPKDIVSGDFYWYNKVETGDKTYFFIGVLDCTRHGVPGAFMSMIGNTLLNEIVNSKRIYETDQIFENLDKLIKTSLRQEISDNNDGMDACFCRIEKTNGSVILNYTGAKLPLIFYNSKKNIVEILEGNHRSVGGYRYNKAPEKFISQQIELHKSDILYLSSDGLGDQNNSDRRRFGKSQIVEILNRNSQKSIEMQKTDLENTLISWMSGTSQRDDISVIGIKI